MKKLLSVFEPSVYHTLSFMSKGGDCMPAELCVYECVGCHHVNRS